MDVTYRLDASGRPWPPESLAVMRQAAPTGIRLGTMAGWNRSAVRPLPTSSLPTGRCHDTGLALGPKQGLSMPLRWGAPRRRAAERPYRKHRASGAAPFAVDLSSERVHRAKWLLDGVRQGSP